MAVGMAVGTRRTAETPVAPSSSRPLTSYTYRWVGPAPSFLRQAGGQLPRYGRRLPKDHAFAITLLQELARLGGGAEDVPVCDAHHRRGGRCRAACAAWPCHLSACCCGDDQAPRECSPGAEASPDPVFVFRCYNFFYSRLSSGQLTQPRGCANPWVQCVWLSSKGRAHVHTTHEACFKRKSFAAAR